MEPFLCFSVQDAKKHFPGFDRKRLTQWKEKGYVEKLVRGYYVFADVSKDSTFWWYISNKIFEPSYISLQSALNHYGFIPEAVFTVTAITTLRTRKFESPDMRFLYRNIKPACYFGFTLAPFREKHVVRLASPEKAILDFLYLETKNESVEDFEALRLNKSTILGTIQISKMDNYAILMANISFQNRYRKFKKWLYA